MRNLAIIFGALLIATVTLAQPSTAELFKQQSQCGNFVHLTDDSYFTGFGSYSHPFNGWRTATPNRVLSFSVKHPNRPKVWNTKDSAIDMQIHDNRAFVLTFSGLEEWDLVNNSRVATYPTHLSRREFKRREHPRGLALYNNLLVIAHGTLGLSVFDIDQRKVVKDVPLVQAQRPLVSQVVDVTIEQGIAFALLDNVSLVPSRQKPAFRGLVLYDIETDRVLSELDGLDPGADAIVSDKDRLIISFMGQPIWSYKLKDFIRKSSKMPKPHRRSWKFPHKGHPTKKPFFSGNEYFTCYMKAPQNKGGRYSRQTMVLDTQKTFGL